MQCNGAICRHAHKFTIFPQLLSPEKKMKCNRCGVVLDDKYMLPSHIKRVHMKVSSSETLIACPIQNCGYRHLSQESQTVEIDHLPLSLRRDKTLLRIYCT